MGTVQVINQDKTFLTEELQKILEDCHHNAQLKVVSILGPQSSGKSTLLNGLFGTEFQVMDEARRRQTTKGIWGSRAKGSDILVLDIEGTDGRERGEDQDFERKSALFALALSGILMINIWENSVGLYHAANMSLLRTVMDVHLSLVDPSKKEKTVLLFIIRDYAGKTPKNNLAQVLTDDLTQIWDSVKKPDIISNLKLSDAFDLKFECLPHKILQPDRFSEEVYFLKGRFENPRSSEYLFPKNSETMATAPDFAKFASHIWETIDRNKDLDLPTEREMFSQYRCDEIAMRVLGQFNDSIDRKRISINKGDILEGIGQFLQSQISNSKDEFQIETQRYSNSAVLRKLQDLHNDLYREALSIVAKQMDNKMKKVLYEFDESIDDFNINTHGISEFLSALMKRAEIEFESTLIDTVPDFEDQRQIMDSYMSEFDRNLMEREDNIKSEFAIIMSQKEQKKLERKLQVLRHSLFGMSNDEDFWVQFWLLLQDCNELVLSSADSISTDLGLSDKKSSRLFQELSNSFQEFICSLIKEEFSDSRTVDRILSKFEKLFSYDENNLPRIWKNELEVETIFLKASENAMDELKNLQTSDIPPWVSNSPLKSLFKDDGWILFDESSHLNIKSLLSAHFDRRFIDAKRSAVSSQNKIPPWVFLLLLVLGWNELMAILSNPIYFIIALLLVSCFAAVKVFNLGPYLNIGVNYAIKHVRQYLPSNLNLDSSRDGKKLMKHSKDD